MLIKETSQKRLEKMDMQDANISFVFSSVI